MSRGNQTFYVECKRLSKTTQYSEQERKEWQKRWKQLVQNQMKYPHSVFMNVEFKDEVKNTDLNIVASAFEKIVSCDDLYKGCSFEDKCIKVFGKHIDMKRVADHFDKWMVKYPSPQLHALFDDNYDPHGSYTFACNVKLVEVAPSEDSVINIFAESIDKVYCTKWECTADESIDRKAKDVKNLLVKAVKQAPKVGSTIVHIGYETLEGPNIEFIRDYKIVKMLSEFTFDDKDIASVFCHSFQSRVFPDNEWDFAETTRDFGFSCPTREILTDNLLMERDGTKISDENHWTQDLRERKKISN